MIEYMNYKEAMKYLGFKSITGLYTYIDAGLPVIIVGNSKRISKKILINLCKNM